MDLVQKVLITLLVVLIATLILFYVQTNGIAIKSSGDSSHRQPSFLILGTNGAGKTAFYNRLMSQDNQPKFEQTVSSIEPTFGHINLPLAKHSIAKTYQIIDYPGHLKYTQLLNKLILEDITLQKIKGIVYVIDSSAAATNGPRLLEVAHGLFLLLSQTEKLNNGIDILFAVNKQDLFDSRPVFKVKELLQQEVDKLVKNELMQKSLAGHEASGIDEEDDDTNRESLKEFWSSVVGRNGRFLFDMLEGNMDFIGGSVLKNKTEDWENWCDEKVMNQL